MPTLYESAKAAGLVAGSHESDLYLYVTPEALRLVKSSGLRVSDTFRDNVTGRPCVEVFGAFDPFWKGKTR